MTKKKWQINFNLFCKSIGGILISEAFNAISSKALPADGIPSVLCRQVAANPSHSIRPALVKEGVCIVITPLIALMKDQVQHLRERGILADAIYADKSRNEILQTLDNCIFGGVKILYVSPERLASELFQTKLKHIHVSFITVDEAHCISQWGYDFRPSYLNIASIRDMKPNTPILALTATATPDVVNDIQEKLHFEKKNVFKMSFERKNLAYIVRTVGDKINEMVHILRCTEGSAIVYARSRKRTKEIATLLNQNGIKSTFYHAGLLPSVKDERQKAWQQDEVRVIVATNAFGMGIDKPDVRMVIHIDCPDSLKHISRRLDALAETATRLMPYCSTTPAMSESSGNASTTHSRQKT